MTLDLKNTNKQPRDLSTDPIHLDRVFCADNLGVMRLLKSGSIDLIYADPPFNTNRTRVSSATNGKLCQFRDKSDGGLDGYLADLRPRLGEMRRLLPDSGSLYVHLDYRTVHYVKVMLDELFGQENFLNEIIWSYRTGGRQAKYFGRKHDTILLYAKKAGAQVFNPQRGVPYRTLDLKYDSEGRPFKSTRNGPLYFDPRGAAVTDVWDLPFLSTVSTERLDYPSQKPERLLERIVKASSNEGGVVADFYCGSGTTLAVAKRLGRSFVGCDANPDAVAITERRLATLPGQGR